MTEPIRLCLVLHNHQPIGNFDHVFEQAFQDSYLPFLEVFERYQGLKISLHTSGPLMEWLAERHGEYLDRVKNLVAAGRVEIIGGPFYEPILTMLPGRDRIGQITTYTKWLGERFATDVQGMWMPERVWEQSLAADLVDAGMKYTLLDDFHFKNAGLTEDELHGYYITEDDGRVLSIFPGSERLRYLIPFADPQQTIDYLGQIAHDHPGAVVVFGDDGEKFGTWPDTKKHVYDNGWLRKFFDALSHNSEWIHTTTLAEASANVPPRGSIYLPDGSYREMTEWALPTDVQMQYERPRTRDGARRALAADQAFYPRRLLAEFQGQVSRSERNVRPHDDGQPAIAGGDRRRDRRRGGRSGPPRAVSRAMQLQLLARGVRRHLPAASAQRRLQPFNRRGQPHRPSHR